MSEPEALTQNERISKLESEFIELSHLMKQTIMLTEHVLSVIAVLIDGCIENRKNIDCKR